VVELEEVDKEMGEEVDEEVLDEELDVVLDGAGSEYDFDIASDWGVSLPESSSSSADSLIIS